MMDKQIRVLYIDDYPLDRALVRDSLMESELDFQIFEAVNQEEFYKLLSKDFDLVLSDFNILGFTGLEVLDVVREVSPTLPVIIVTGTGSEEIAAEAIKRGAADYVIKSPRHIRRLPLTIQSVLEKTELIINQQKEHQELVESEARYSHLLNTLQEGIWTIDSQGVTTLVNPAMAEMLGYDVSEMVGRHLFDFMDQQGKEQAQQNLERRQQGQADQHDFIFLHKNGEKVHTNLITNPIIDQDGNYQGAVAAVRDITMQVMAEQALQNSRLELQTLVENTPGSIWVLDKDYQLVSANSKFLDDMEKAFQITVRKGYQLLSKISREEKREWKAYYDRAFAGEKFQIERRRRKGEPDSWYEYFFSPIRDEDGIIREVMVQGMNITTRKSFEISLAESREKYLNLVDQMGTALFLHDMDGNLIEVNQQTIDRYGFSREELLALTAGDIDPDYDDREQGGDFWDELLKGENQRFTARHRTKDGTTFPVEISLTFITLQGEPHILALATDITDRLKDQRLLSERELRYRTLTEESPAAIFETDQDGNCIYVNTTWQDISGLTAEQAAGKGWTEGIHPQDRDWIRDAWYHFAHSGGIWNQEYRFQDKDGQTTWVQSEAVPLKDEQEQIQGYLGTNTIITDRKEIEEQLQETNRTLDALLGNLPGMAFRCRNNPDWEMLFCSEGTKTLTGYSPTELIEGTIIKFNDLIHPDDRMMVWEYIQETLTENKPYQVQYRITHRDGEERWVQEQGLATKTDRDGNVIELDGFIQDITTRKLAVQNLAQTSESLTTVLNSIDAHIYVSDLDSYEILYMNDQMASAFQGDHTGEKCYQVFRGKSTPCPNCPVPELVDEDGNPTGPHSWESRNETTGRWYLNTDRAIPWKDRQLVHIQIAVDIHDRKISEQSLQESEQRFRSSFEDTTVAMALVDQEGKFLSVNQAACDLLKYEMDVLLEKTFQEITHPDSLEISFQHFRDCLENHQSYSLEKKYLTQNGGSVIGLTSVSPVFSPQGDFLYAIAHLVDITTQKQIEQELRTQQDFYHQILNSVQEGIWVTNQKDRLIYYNPGMEIISGTSAEEMLGKSMIFDFYPGTNQEFLKYYLQAKGEAVPVEYDAQVKTPTGQDTIQTGWLIPRMKDGQYQGMIGTTRDVTEERLNALELERSEEKYRSLFENLLIGFALHEIVLDQHNQPIDYIFLDVNSAFEKIVGLKREKVIGGKVTEVLPGIENDTANWIQRYGQVALKGETLRTEQYSETLERWYSVVAYSPAPGQFATVIEDITKKKEIEKILRRSNIIVNSISDAVILTDTEGQITYWNSGAERIYGYSTEEALGQSIRMVYSEENYKVLDKFIADLLQGKELTNEEATIVNKAGQDVEILLSLSSLKDSEGKITELIGVTKDITPIRNVEKSLRLEKQRTQQYLDVAEIMLLALDTNQRVQAINPKGCELLGYPEEEILGENWFENFLDPVEVEQVKEVYDQVISGGLEPVEYYENFIIRADGKRRLIAWRNSVLEDKDGNVIGVFSSGEDITDRREAEVELLKSKETAERYLNIAAEIILSLDLDGTITLLNPSGHRLLGYQPGELMGKNWWDTCLPKGEKPQIKQVFSELLAGNTSGNEMVEGKVITKSGESKEILWHNSILRDDQGRITGTLSSGQDITQQTAILEDLTRSRQLLISLSQAASQIQNLVKEEEVLQTIGKEISQLGFNTSILVLSEDGSHLRQKYLSYESDLLAKATELTGIIIKDFTIKLEPGSYFSHILEEQTTFLGTIEQDVLKEALPRLTKPLAGTLRKLFGLQSAIFAPLIVNDHPQGLIAVLGENLAQEDVPPIALFANQASTALRNARYTEDLRQRTKELEELTSLIAETEEAERKRLSQELHDQVGQSLALLGFTLNQIQDQLESKDVVDIAKITNAQQILGEITNGIRSVMDDLRPAILDDYGLLPALHWYADKISNHSGMEISVVGKTLDPPLEKRKEVALFRITQEALTNITRHAQASRVDLNLSQSKTEISLTITDDGVGFDPLEVKDQEHTSGWGLINMQERSLRIGGSLTVDTEPGKGTRLHISLPRE